MNRSSLLASLAFTAVCVSQVGATDCGQILADSGFDLWCGDQLCYWKLERGEIAQVATWRSGDDGVSMIGDDVAISQRTGVNDTDTDCIRFDMVANIEETAEVHLEADVFGDGTVEWTERIPTSSWDAVSMRIGISGPYQGVTFRLTKTGSGEATLAQIKAEVVEDGDGGCPSYLDPVARPLGAFCDDASPCDDGTCVSNVCSECRDGSGCESGEVCGRESELPGLHQDWYACVEAFSRGLGEPCYVDAECASDACTGQVCGECNGSTGCAGGEACVVVQEDVAVRACATGPRASGEPCATDAMCESGVCEGPQFGHCDLFPSWFCDADDDCPVLGGVPYIACNLFAVAGGSCQ